MPALQKSVLYWSEVSPKAKSVVFSTLLAVQHFHCWPNGWNVGQGSVVPGDLRFVGRHAAPGSGHPGSGLLLGVHEGQPAAPELHIEGPHRHPSLAVICHLLTQPGRKEDGFKTKQNIYIYLIQPHEEVVLPVPSLLVKRVSKTGWWQLPLLYIYW